MSSPTAPDEDEVDEEVEFVSEAPLRPVLDCIDLLSDSEEEGSSNLIEEQINRQKAHVASALDRLAHKVAAEKQERADKCRAFKEKQISQRAHGQRELAVSSRNGNDPEARRCVDMWLKMPGVRPGVLNAGSRSRYNGNSRHSFPGNSSTRHTCPVVNCGRVYDNVPLLEGHLKRFDHSPCDPTIHLKGSQSEIFACVACGQQFQTEDLWRNHLESKVSSSNPEGHIITQTWQLLVCFACPACYLLFSLRDECLQHMSATNHFTEALPMTAYTGGGAMPVPIARYAKNRLIALCKDVPFSVLCSICRKVLSSHQTAQAHFNVQCRQGCAVAVADKTMVQVMKQLQVRGQCSLCCKIFLAQDEIERHKESTQHGVEVNQTMSKAILQYCHFSEIQHAKRAQERRLSRGPEVPQQRRDSVGSPAKRKRLDPSVRARRSRRAWVCECGLHFSEEATATEHLLAVNQIFHQCGVCGKLMGESSITRLHMSRFHGGAHLSNFLFHCRSCKVDMPRYQDILSHVSEAHSGHTYFAEREVTEEPAATGDAKSSASGRPAPHAHSKPADQPTTAAAAAASSRKPDQTWMCRMCEDVFDSKAAVHEHCSDVSGHSFQRFICGHCPQKFFKESTVRRHCTSEHGGQVRSHHFCGLCDSMPFGSEKEFSEHYKCVHSQDYYCLEDASVDGGGATTVVEDAAQLERVCLCMGSEKSKEERKVTFTRCMKSLAAEGKCTFVCDPCGVAVPSYAQIKTHVATIHTAMNLEKDFQVKCCACQESFQSVPSFHKHYHVQHCALQPCLRQQEDNPETVKILSAVEIKPDADEIEDDELAVVLNPGEANKESGASFIEHEAASSGGQEWCQDDLEEALKRSMLEF